MSSILHPSCHSSTSLRVVQLAVSRYKGRGSWGGGGASLIRLLGCSSSWCYWCVSNDSFIINTSITLLILIAYLWTFIKHDVKIYIWKYSVSHQKQMWLKITRQLRKADALRFRCSCSRCRSHVYEWRMVLPPPPGGRRWMLLSICLTQEAYSGWVSGTKLLQLIFVARFYFINIFIHED